MPEFAIKSPQPKRYKQPTKSVEPFFESSNFKSKDCGWIGGAEYEFMTRVLGPLGAWHHFHFAIAERKPAGHLGASPKSRKSGS